MRCGIRVSAVAILLMCLLAPLGVCCAMQCQRAMHPCCASTAQMADDCCLRHLNSPSTTAPEKDCAMSAPALELASIEFAVPDSHAGRVVGEALRHVPVPQSPPLVLRT